MARVLICGDYAPTPSNQQVLSKGDVGECLGESLAKLFSQQSLVAVNLETSLVLETTPKTKRGQINQAKPDTCTFLKNAGIGLCFLANNHTIDNGNAGLRSTMETLNAYQIPFMGAGYDSERASRPFRVEVGDKTICFLNIANYEFNRCTQTEYGVHVYDPLEIFDYIRGQKRDGEILVVVYHGGVEYYQYPSPGLQKICRKFVDCGADVVLCQHSHCVGTYERYDGGYILYGQGNFLFDDSDKQLEKTAVLVELDTETKNITLIPIEKTGSLVQLAEGERAKAILDGIEKRHCQIQDPEFLQTSFEQFAQGQRSEICNALLGYNRLYRLINKLTGKKLEAKIYNKKALMRLYNIVNSPALQEVLNEVLSQYE